MTKKIKPSLSSQPQVSANAEVLSPQKDSSLEAYVPHFKEGILAKIEFVYVHQYRVLLFLSTLLFVLALLQIGVQYAVTGDFIHRGVSLKGGVTVTVPEIGALHQDVLHSSLQEAFPDSEIVMRTLVTSTGATAVIVEADIVDSQEIERFITTLQEKVGGDRSSYSIEIIGSTLGQSFFKQALSSLGVAFLLMGIVVFLYFRIPIPCLAVILAALSDMVVTLAILNIFGVKLSTAGIAALLMMIGYSVDTDMLLTIRVLKEKEGTVLDRVYRAMKTGVVMNFAALAAVIVALLFSKSEVLTQIMLILGIGLIVDLIYTWVQNVAILRWYLEKNPIKSDRK